MKLHQFGIVSETELKQTFTELSEQYGSLTAETKFLAEDFALSDEAYAMLNTIEQRLGAAKRGLGIVNKLSPGPSKTKHASRVMSNMNAIRGQLARVSKILQDSLAGERSNQSLAAPSDF